MSTEEVMLLNCGVGEDSWVSWTARRSNQSIPKEISPEYSLEGLMPKLKLQYYGHLMRTTDSLEKTLMLRKTEGGRRRTTEDEMVGWHHHPMWVWVKSGVGNGQRSQASFSPWGHKELVMTEWLNWLKLHCPWDFPGNNTGGGCLLLLQSSFICCQILWVSWNLFSLATSQDASSLPAFSNSWLWIYPWSPIVSLIPGENTDIPSPLMFWNITLSWTLFLQFSFFSHSVMSDSSWPHELQHARPPCPSPAPGVYPNSCPLSIIIWDLK